MHNELITLWADNAFDLTQHRHCSVVGEIPANTISHGLSCEHLHRPRRSLPPQHNRALPADSPLGLLTLYEIAKKDLCCLGFKADDLYLYALYQSGRVAPDHALREGQWHCDLMRNLRNRSHEGKIPVTIGYGVSTILPTVYTTGLLAKSSLPARQTIENMEDHHRLGETAQMAGQVFQPRPGQVGDIARSGVWAWDQHGLVRRPTSDRRAVDCL